MPICKPEDLKNLLPPRGRLLGMDVGSKTVGLALSDDRLTLATPQKTIARTKFKQTATEIEQMVNSVGVEGFVVGWPLNMDGTEGPRCQATRQFARNLLAVMDLPLVFWDERLSTAAMERQMITADLSRAQRAAKIDAAAAAYILQGCLDRLNSL